MGWSRLPACSGRKLGDLMGFFQWVSFYELPWTRSTVSRSHSPERASMPWSSRIQPINNPSHAGYRRDIDGLRALAVLAVVVFHAFPQILPGGFVGVDVFFVISGYLISGILFSDLQRGEFTYREFYVRRMRRIFPALALVLAACLIFGWLVLLDAEYTQLGGHVAAGAGFIANLALWRESGYFATAAELKPLLHLWSLGIEEQFYFVWPLVLAIAWPRRWMGAVLAAVTLGSFALGWWWSRHFIIGAFYLPVPRFWELALGGLLAWHTRAYGRESPSDARGIEKCTGWRAQFPVAMNLLSVAGLLLLLLSMTWFDKTTRFPGVRAMVPTLGTVFVILAGEQAWPNRMLLAHPWMVFIGLISYPLYLWHWPFLVFGRVLWSDIPPVVVRMMLVLISVVLAWATYTWLEKPIRRTMEAHNPKRAPTLGALVSFMVLIGFSGVAVQKGYIPVRLHTLSSLSEAKSDWDYPGDDKAHRQGIQEGTVLFFGDSFIQQYFSRVRWLVEHHAGTHRSVRFHTEEGCAPVPGVTRKSIRTCGTFADAGFRLAQQKDIVLVIVGGHWLGMVNRGDYFFEDDPQERVIDFYGREGVQVFAKLTQELAQLKAAGKQVQLVLNPPGGQTADPRNLMETRIFAQPSLVFRSIPMQEHVATTGVINAKMRAVAAQAGIPVLDPAEWMCSSSECAVTEANGVPIFYDSTHLRASYVEKNVRVFDDFVVPQRKHVIFDGSTAKRF
jgi:peptidoglycan/LPS O-acetylase OafA/YrhL